MERRQPELDGFGYMAELDEETRIACAMACRPREVQIFLIPSASLKNAQPDRGEVMIRCIFRT